MLGGIPFGQLIFKVLKEQQFLLLVHLSKIAIEGLGVGFSAELINLGKVKGGVLTS
jgi:hypothetical protein